MRNLRQLGNIRRVVATECPDFQLGGAIVVAPLDKPAALSLRVAPDLGIEAPLRDMKNTAADLVRLLGRVAASDRDAFAALYDATAAKLYGVILRILRRRDLADEILQDVYVRIWQHAGDFDAARASPITWMASIARNRAIDEARKRGHLSIEDTPAASEVADPQALASDVLETSDELRRLEACLDALGAEKKALVKLAYLEGMTRQELADRSGQPVATIKTWLHRSLKQLKDCLSS